MSNGNFGRRTWNREDYKDYEPRNKLDDLNEEQLYNLKLKYLNYDKLMRDSMKNLNMKVLSSGNNEFKRGKQFGFYCELCDLTFKDSLQYIDHLNHKTHEIKFNSLFNEELISDKRDNDDVPIEEFKNCLYSQIQSFIKVHDTSRKRTNTDKNKILNKRKNNKSDNTNKKNENESNSEMNKLLGFSNFGSTKK